MQTPFLRLESTSGFVLVLAAVLACVFWLYLPGLTGAFLFDDHAVIVPLRGIRDFEQAAAYILSGDSGPLGRPLSLLTFVLQRAPSDDAMAYLAVNLAIHLANGALVAWIVRKIALALTEDSGKSCLVALSTAALWLVLPINAATTLIVVQRMTLLSAFFVLAGVALYLAGRDRLGTRPLAALVLMTAAIAVCVPAAVFSKENGILLPVFILVLEATVLSSAGKAHGMGRWFGVWKVVFLIVPSVVLLSYLVVLTQGYLNGPAYANRQFDLFERIGTQSVVLADYLRLHLFARPHEISPFYDDYPVITAGWPAFANVALFSVWVLLAWGLYRLRGRYAWLSFAGLWFLAGHLLESSVVPLELVFLHRNYLPSMGIAFLACFGLIAARTKYAPLLASIVLLLVLVQGYVMREVAITWGSPRIAAELWLIERPGSVRAAEFLEQFYVEEDDHRTARRIIRAAYAENPRDSGLVLDNLRTYCDADDSDPAIDIAAVAQELGRAAFNNRATQKIDRLIGEVEKGRCALLDPNDLRVLIEAFEQNREVRYSSRQRHNFELLKFRLALMEGDFGESVARLERAYRVHASPDTARLMVELLISAGLEKEAIEFLDGLAPPGHMSRRETWVWRARIEATRELAVRAAR